MPEKKTLNEEELDNAQGGAIGGSRYYYRCKACGREWSSTVRDNKCPTCGSGNIESR